MNDYLDQVRTALESGAAVAQHTVLLFRAIEEAELQRDVEGLEQALELARRISLQGDGRLREESERLVGLCAERLDVVRAITRTAEVAGTSKVPAGSDSACPGCGRALSGSPVRCRYCGQVFV